MRYYFESYWAHTFPKHFVYFLQPFVCLHESGRFALDPLRLNLESKRYHGRGVEQRPVVEFVGIRVTRLVKQIQEPHMFWGWNGEALFLG